jgi:hypothetical protein
MLDMLDTIASNPWVIDDEAQKLLTIVEFVSLVLNKMCSNIPDHPKMGKYRLVLERYFHLISSQQPHDDHFQGKQRHH